MEERWVSVTEAARLETEAGRPINKSSISRFLARNPDVAVKRDTPDGPVKLVEYSALVAARSGSLSVQDALRAPDPVAPVRATEEAPAEQSATFRKRSAEAERLELQLARAKGEVVDRLAVKSAIEAAGVAFVQALERRRRTLATAIAGIEDIRVIELTIKAEDRKLLDNLVAALAKAASGELVEDGQPQPS